MSSRPRIRPLARVGLETSLKPFPSWSEADVAATASTMFDQWRDLLGEAESATVLLWVADGSELLQWNGDFDRELDWASSVGFSNTEFGAYPHAVTPDNVAQPYRDDVPTLRYRDIRRLVDTIRRAGEERLGVPVTVGATFDPGPEFTRSPFKYEEHPEIVAADKEGEIGRLIRMIRANSVLHADERPFAGYPDGIPEGTVFGEFLGRQADSYLEAMGFDYLWLSNGFGFSAYSWTPLGEVYDGETFHPDRVPAVAGTLLEFWRVFTAECRFPIEVRGTNFSAGIDLGADAVPTREIYRAGSFRNPPPNSPWGPLNEDFGIELAGYLSRIAEVPGDGFLFRFYVNDPWFWQNPWWDFYHREPFDIDLPLSVSRIDERGAVRTASDVQFLSIDTERGELDPRAGREVSSHVLRALEAAPDEAGPVVWLYPLDEYAADAESEPASIPFPFFEDWYLTAGINAGAPINTVVSTGSLAAAVEAGTLDGRIVVTPTRSLRGAVLEQLVTLSGRGARILAYGPAERADDAGRRLLGLWLADALEGDLEFTTTLAADTIAAGTPQRPLRHVAALSGGGVREVADPDADAGVAVLASVRGGGGGGDDGNALHVGGGPRNGDGAHDAAGGGDHDGSRAADGAHDPHGSRDGDGSRATGDADDAHDASRGDDESRAYATRRGAWAWVRGSSTFDRAPLDEHGFRPARALDPAEFEEAGAVLRRMLGELGVSCGFVRRTTSSRVAVQTLHASDNALRLSGYLADTTTRPRYRLPLGAPLATGHEAWFEGGHTEYAFGKSMHAEVRLFAQQESAGTLTCRESPAYPHAMTRTLTASGFTDALVHVTVPRDATQVVLVRDDQADLNLIGDVVAMRDVTTEAVDGLLTLEHVTGTIVVSWSTPD